LSFHSRFSTFRRKVLALSGGGVHYSPRFRLEGSPAALASLGLQVCRHCSVTLAVTAAPAVMARQGRAVAGQGLKRNHTSPGIFLVFLLHNRRKKLK